MPLDDLPTVGDLPAFFKDALCPETDPEIFFPEKGQGAFLTEIEQAKRVCRRCPILDQCREWALEEPGNTLFGVWGALTQTERMKIRAARAREAA
jgi:WhiB family transcriptional regulator, redox-sensing transcriptional regulator